MRDYPETEWSMEVHSLRIPSHTPFLSSNETAEHEKIFKEGARMITVRGGEVACLSLHAFVCCAPQKRNGVVSPGLMPHPRNQHVRRHFVRASHSICPLSVPTCPLNLSC